MQRHVFNAHYLAYADDACNAWFRSVFGEQYLNQDIDFVVKRADITWHGSAGFDDLIAIDVAVRRWGTTSFAIGFDGSVAGDPVFEAVITYVYIDEDGQARPVPESLRTALG